MSNQKTLSKGTLSLRFMQNAQRAKQQKEVELDKAEVKDDGEWEVSQETREAWGIGQSQTASQVTFEASYIPFVFRSPSPSSSKLDIGASSEVVVLPKGRRRFKNGQEVEVEEQPPPQPNTAQTNSQSKPTRLKSISGSSIAVVAKSAKAPKPSEKSGATARQTIFDTSGTGTDLRSKNAPKVSPLTSGLSFMKPSGVDEPLDSKRPQTIDVDSSPASTPEGLKRGRENSGGRPDDASKPRKKKKRRTSIE